MTMGLGGGFDEQGPTLRSTRLMARSAAAS